MRSDNCFLIPPIEGVLAALDGWPALEGLAADVVFYAGLTLEGKMADTLVKVARGGKPVFAVTEQVDEATLLYERILHRLGLRTAWVRPVAEAVVDPAKSSCRKPDSRLTTTKRERPVRRRSSIRGTRPRGVCGSSIRN